MMTKEQLQNICIKYYTILNKLEEKEATRENDNPDSLVHLKWMLLNIPLIMDEGKIDKANRWLGFVQGVLWSRRILNINEMKDDNR